MNKIKTETMKFTPKEKAKIIYDSFSSLIPVSIDRKYKQKAKLASIICINNMISMIDLINNTDLDSVKRTYLTEVKHEIINNYE